MDLYVGQTRARAFIQRLQALGIGECTQPGEYPPRRHPWFYDNGAYKAWTSGTEWDPEPWRSVLRDVSGGRGVRPAFAVAPDRVGGGSDSLRMSMAYRDEIDVPAYLAVQDGMTEEEVAQAAFGAKFAGLFVGGTLEWKLRTGAKWAELSRKIGVKCHIGRVGPTKRTIWAREIGADSIDSCFPLWESSRVAPWVAAARNTSKQTHLWEAL